MSEWKETEIGKHIDLISGYAFKSADFLSERIEGAFPIIKIKNVANGDVNLKDVVFHKYDPTLKKYLLSEGDVLISMTGNHPQAETQVVGEVSRYKLREEALLNQRVGKLIVKDETNLDFIYYLFKNDELRSHLANQSSGSANQANISKADILGLTVSIPPPTEQTAIASVLSGFDDKIDLLQRQNETLEKMAETLFRQWFVDEAKEEWEEKSLGELLTITSSKRIFYSEYVSSGIPFYRSKEIIELRGSGSTSSNLYISNERFNEIDSKYGSPKKGDILMTSVGTLGVAYRVKANENFYFKDGNLTWFKDFKGLPSSIIYLWIISKIGQDELAAIAIGSTQPALTIEGLKSIAFKIPPKEIISICENQFERIISKIDSNQTQIRTLISLRDTLLPKLMNGEVGVEI